MPLPSKDALPLQAPSERVQEHPLFTGSTSVGIISAQNPRFSPQASGHENMGEALKQMGLKAHSRKGMYGMPEQAWMVYGPTREQMFQLGKQFGQESVVYSPPGANPKRHELLYTNGPNAGRYHPALDHEWFDREPEDYYTHLPELGGYLRLNFDWDQLHHSKLQQDQAVDALQARAAHPGTPQPVTKSEIRVGLVRSLRKAIGMDARPHPHAYPWHNSHTDHHLQVMSPGVVLRSTKGMAKAEGDLPPEGTAHLQSPNEQAAGVGVSTYAKFATPYGSVDKGQKTDLYHYPYHGKNQDVDRLLKDHGYTSYYAGGKYGRPDLANRNYNTKHLMIYDPSPGSGGDFGTEAYTDAWRKIHELSHALTYPDLNKMYGEGRRIGKLGTHRTLNEALRAVHWEWLAAHKQRELSEQLGVHIPDHVFNKELNTVMHDAIHRAVTGKFTEPSDEGFRPHEHAVPLETALGMVRESAHNLGVTGMHDLKKKAEGTTMSDEKVYEPKEWRLSLAKAIKERVDAYSKQMLELRQRELKKNLAHDPALAGPAPEMKPVEKCLICKEEDRPGKCKCLAGPMAGIRKDDVAGYPGPDAASMLGKDEMGAARNDSKTSVGSASTAGDMSLSEKPVAKAEMCKSCGMEHAPGKHVDADGDYDGDEVHKGDDEDKYNYYLVHKETGKIHGGNEYKEDAHAAVKDHPEAGKLKVSHRSRVPHEAKQAFHAENKIEHKMHKAEPLAKPSVSEEQHNAMEAAAHGHSTLGIPKKVGKEFVQADKVKKTNPLPESAELNASERPEVVPQNSPEQKKFREDNKKATKAGKKGVPARPGDGVAKGELKCSNEPVKQHKSGGNGIKLTRLKLSKAALPGAKAQMAQHGAIAGSKAAAGAPAPAPAAPKLPSPAEHAGRAATFAQHMPKPAAPAPAVHNLTGSAKIKAVGQEPIASTAAPKLPGMGAKAAGAPPAGTAHLKAPGAAPKLPGLGAAGAPKPAAPAAPAAPKAPGLGKAESTEVDLKKSLGSCLLCGKPEHTAQCS